MSTEWQVAAQRYLARLANAEYKAGLRQWTKPGRMARSYRHSPSQYHRDLVECLGRNDEEGFKVRKMLEGHASVIGV